MHPTVGQAQVYLCRIIFLKKIFYIYIWALGLLVLAEQLSAVISSLAAQGGATVEKLHSALGVPAGDAGLASALTQARESYSFTRFVVVVVVSE